MNPGIALEYSTHILHALGSNPGSIAQHVAINLHRFAKSKEAASMRACSRNMEIVSLKGFSHDNVSVMKDFVAKMIQTWRKNLWSELLLEFETWKPLDSNVLVTTMFPSWKQFRGPVEPIWRNNILIRASRSNSQARKLFDSNVLVTTVFKSWKHSVAWLIHTWRNNSLIRASCSNSQRGTCLTQMC